MIRPIPMMLIAAALSFGVVQAGQAQQTTSSSSPDYRTTNGNQIGTGNRGQATSSDANAMQNIQNQIQQQRAMAAQERQQRQQQQNKGP